MNQGYLIITEGQDDVQVLVHLLNRYHMPLVPRDEKEPLAGHIKLESKGSIEKLLDYLRVELKLVDEDVAIEAMEIMVDADENIEWRWQALRDIFRNNGYSSTPEMPDPEGTIIVEEGRMRLGVWLMPDNQLAGTIEHFIQMLIPNTDNLWKHATASVDQIPLSNRLFPESHTIKAQLHTWLAWQEEPGRPLGQAINNRYLNARAPEAQRLIAWIRRLFPNLA